MAWWKKSKPEPGDGGDTANTTANTAPEPVDPVALVLAYHERTKHHPGHYARALGYMDWDTQPDPFRRYEGAPRIVLPRNWDDAGPRFDDLFGAGVEPAPVSARTISRLFFDSLAISAWKEYGGSRWALRCNPSSGNLHPTEGYLLAGAVEGIGDTPALYHYRPIDHALERRRTLDGAAWSAVADTVGPDSLLVALTSIHWREAWKYGERAFRYCQHDVGHAIAAVAYAAAALGWSASVLDEFDDDTLAALLGVAEEDGSEAEHPDVLMVVTPKPVDSARLALDGLCVGELAGAPNALSAEHHDWPVIDAVVLAARRSDASPPTGAAVFISNPPVARERPVLARAIIRQRRSAVDMDGVTTMPAADFFGLLDRLLSRADAPPFCAWPHGARVHPIVFVHRVVGVEPGLYTLVRDDAEREALRAAMRPEFAWSVVPGAPDSLRERFLLLRAGDLRGYAAGISCQQAIAGDGAFAVGMIARFEASIRERGAWFYRRLFWETGLIGQALYLEAEAAGLRGTGIGCYFDDSMHDLLGLRGREYQSLYHFTIGGPVDDPRLRTLDGYDND